MTENNSPEGEQSSEYSLYLQHANDWESEFIRGQLTHIQSHPSVEFFVKQGKEAVPFIVEKLLKNRLWYIPLEKIIRKEFDVSIRDTGKVSYPLGSGYNKDLDNRLDHLEWHRQECLEWAIKNGYLEKPV